VKHIRPGLRAVDRLILTRIAQFDENTPATPAPVSSLSDDELAAEFARVRERGTELAAIEGTLSAEQNTELAELASRLSEVQAEQNTRAQAAAQLQANREAFTTLPPAEPVTPAEPAVTPPAEPAVPVVTAAAVPAVPSVATMAPATPPVAPVAPVAQNEHREFSIRLTTDGAGALGVDRNREVTTGDPTRHPEFELARWAAANMTPPDRATATVYTSGEHCPMCSAAHGWAGLGRIVYATSSQQLGGWLAELGAGPSPVLALPITQVVPGLVVAGPAKELAEQVRDLHRRFRSG